VLPEKQKPRRVSVGASCLRRDLCCESNLGAVEWIRTTTVLLPPAPQAGASASSATTAQAVKQSVNRIIGGFQRGVNIRAMVGRSQNARHKHDIVLPAVAFSQ
jgi:hypothetical protein